MADVLQHRKRPEPRASVMECGSPLSLFHHPKTLDSSITHYPSLRPRNRNRKMERGSITTTRTTTRTWTTPGVSGYRGFPIRLPGEARWPWRLEVGDTGWQPALLGLHLQLSCSRAQRYSLPSVS